METERRVDNDKMMFMLGEVHTLTKNIPGILKELAEGKSSLHKCQVNQNSKIAKGRKWNKASAFGGGMFGGFLAILGSKLMVG